MRKRCAKTFRFEDIAEQQVADDENGQQSAEGILSRVLAIIPDNKLTGFALRLALPAHASVPRQGELDYLAEAEAAFVPPPPKKIAKAKKERGSPAHQILFQKDAGMAKPGKSASRKRAA